ncbi:MAG: LpxL/LpxP family Kdo(2)-lipid IV(A) lauroyl/palmitoleoyl acyltransferase [Candidatus Endonucleobacter bathymodioli]|uniref:Lipid A biosynthesis acyltransferase n=1 Tax=Candidatus Endonucleibacter bathymodioli TaxID=539814 RepID=A0AA90SSJ0_9GAMM|nr:LpxL/LpxP family Kdo(2)-lipid IV(A) lauroyl/palmitoleoyl acyltransferase [Candidatus Endonucleobacter bathymodioli]
MTKDHLNKTRADHFQWCFFHPRYWITWLGLGLSILPTLLPYRVIFRIGNGCGWLLFKLAHSRVHIARVNLKLCFPKMHDNEIEQLLRANFQSVGMGLMEVAIAWWWSKKRLEKKVYFEGLEHLRQDQQGRGTILLILHFTTIELSGALITLRHSLKATYREHKNQVFEYMQRRQRLRYDSDSRLLGRRDIRGMLRVLREGGTVWYAPDQDYGQNNSVFARFFDIEAATVTGTARLARIGKARVVPMVVTRLPDAAGYALKVYKPWHDFPKNDDLVDANYVNQFIEARVREHPEQYMWLHRRFKTRPVGENSFYN